MLVALHHRFEPGTQRQRRLPFRRDRRATRCRSPAEKVQAHPLLRAAATQAEGFTISSHELDPLVGEHPAECTTALGDQDEPAVARQVAGSRQVDSLVTVEAVDVGLETSSSDMPVQPLSTASSARYSSAASPRPRP